MSSALSTGKPARTAWVIAMTLAMALHAAGFAAVWLHRSPAEDDDALGAPSIEIGLELTALHEAQENLPPGPEAEDAAAATAVAEQKAKVEKTDLPKAQPTETAYADRVVAPNAAKTPKDDTPNVEAVKANPTEESIATEAAAPPKSDVAKEAPRSTAPVQGSGESVRRARATWARELGAHLNRFKRYPRGGRRAATILVSFTLDRLGHVLAATVQQSSGDPDFDRAALAMLAKADPVPPPPPLIADEGLTYSLPVIFRNKPR